MFKFGKTRRAIAMTAAALALAGGATVTIASPASADTTDGGCRGAADSDPNNHNNPGVWAQEPGGVLLMPCSSGDHTNPNGGIYASLYFDGPANLSVYPCAQLIKIGTGQVADFTCIGDWLPANSDETYGGWQPYPMGFYEATPGEYVVQAGYWATINGVYGYYGGAQSWPVWVSNG